MPRYFIKFNKVADILNKNRNRKKRGKLTRRLPEAHPPGGPAEAGPAHHCSPPSSSSPRPEAAACSHTHGRAATSCLPTSPWPRGRLLQAVPIPLTVSLTLPPRPSLLCSLSPAWTERSRRHRRAPSRPQPPPRSLSTPLSSAPTPWSCTPTHATRGGPSRPERRRLHLRCPEIAAVNSRRPELPRPRRRLC